MSYKKGLTFLRVMVAVVAVVVVILLSIYCKGIAQKIWQLGNFFIGPVLFCTSTE